MQPDRGERCRGRAGIIRPENQLQHQQTRHQLPRHGDVQNLQPEPEHQQPDQAERVHADKVCRWLPGQFRADFSGQIQYSYSGRENPTDTYVVIQAADSDQAHNFAVMNTTLAAGYTQQDVHTALMKPIGVYDIVAGATPEFATTKAPRGKPMFGMHRDEVSSLAAQCKATWRYENGRLQMVPENAYLADAIVLNAQTGLIGMPEQTINGGINVKCLINPNIQLDTLIRLDNKSINQVGLSNQEIATGSTAGASVQQPAVLDMDGDYIVKNIAYYGDTRGNAWYQDMICIAKGGAGLLNQSTIRAGA